MESLSKFIFLFLLCLVHCSNIIEIMPVSLFKAKFKKELKSIEAKKFFQNLTTEDFLDSINSPTINFSNFVPIAHILNTDMFSFTSEKNSFSLSYIKNDTSDIAAYMMYYNVDVSPSVSKSKSEDIETCKARIIIGTTEYIINKTYIKQNETNFYYPIGSVELKFNTLKVEFLSDCSLNVSEIESVLNELLETKQNDWVQRFQLVAVSSFYTQIKILDVYIENASQVPYSHLIDLRFSDIPSLENGYIKVSRLGTIDFSENANDNKKIKIKSDDINDYKIMINSSMIKTLIDDSLFDFTLEQSQNPLRDYALNGKYLKKIAEEIEINDDEEIKLENSMTEVKFDEKENENGISGTVKINSTFVTVKDFSEILNFNWEVHFILNLTNLQNGVNFVLLEKNVNIEKIYNYSQEISNESQLKEWMDLTIKVILARSEYNLFLQSIDLSEYFNRLTKVSITKSDDIFEISGVGKS